MKGVTTCLYPLSVIKTRQMALEGPGGLEVIGIASSKGDTSEYPAINMGIAQH